MKNAYHVPVLLKEVIRYLDPRPGESFIDATLGGGGHTRAILEKGATVIAIDRDPDALAHAREHFGEFLEACPGPQRSAPGRAKSRLRLVKSDFSEIGQLGLGKVDGILFDLGVSSHQLEAPRRGFSFNLAGPLDMRMDPETQQVTAADLVNSLSIHELTALFKNFGQEHRARTIARALVDARRVKPITKADELERVVLRVRPRTGKDRIHPATRIFQALRIAVNSELDSLQQALASSPGLLKKGGRLVVVSFHSLEDGIVKRFLREQSDSMETLTTKPTRPTKEEVEQNPRARSAKMRVAVKL